MQNPATVAEQNPLKDLIQVTLQRTDTHTATVTSRNRLYAWGLLHYPDINQYKTSGKVLEFIHLGIKSNLNSV